MCSFERGAPVHTKLQVMDGYPRCRSGARASLVKELRHTKLAITDTVC